MNRLLVLITFLLCVSNFYAATADSVLVTGNTDSYIEPCGCVGGMKGGIAKRPQVLKEHKMFILLDSGNFVDLENELDRKRNKFYFKSYKEMGYHAVGIAAGDAAESFKWLKEMDQHNLLVASNLVKKSDGKPPFNFTKMSGGYVVASLISDDAEVHKDFRVKPVNEVLNELKKLDKIILLSDLKSSELKSVISALGNKLSLVVANRASSEFERIGGIPVVYPGKQGKFVKKYDFSKKAFSSHPVEEKFVEDKAMKKIIDDFMDEILNDPEMQKSFKRNFEKYELNQQVLKHKNRFIGSENCKTCHLKEFQSYTQTRHSHAMDSLLQVKRDFVPDCVRCHVVGFGYPTGYEIKVKQAWLKQVGCESCHGPGLNHFKNPSKTNITKVVKEERCLECHDEENSPEFDYNEYLPKADHSVKVVETKRVPPKKTDKVDVTLYVMSQCPFGTKAENALFPLVKKYKDKINFKLRFIATDVEEKVKKMNKEGAFKGKKKKEEEKKPKGNQNKEGCNANFELDPTAKFQALHGQSEVDENMRQMLIEHFYGVEKQMDFILARNKNLYGDWKAIAKKMAIDPAKIEKAMKDGTGDKLFRENIKPVNEKGITASPNLEINGVIHERAFQGAPLEFAVCEAQKDANPACKSVPYCTADHQCRKTGKKGKCINKGTPLAQCTFEQPPEVKITVIREDEFCDICESGPFLKQLFQVFPGLKVTFLGKSDAKAEKYIKALRLDRWPAYIFEDFEPKNHPEAKYLQKYLAFAKGYFFVNPLVHDVVTLDIPERTGSLKLFTTTLSKGIGLQNDLIKAVRDIEKKKGKSVAFDIVPMLTHNTKAPKPGEKDERLKVVMADRTGRKQTVFLSSYYGEKEISEAIHQFCLKMQAPRDKYFDYMQKFSLELYGKLKDLKTKEAVKKAIDQFDYNGLRGQIYTDIKLDTKVFQGVQRCMQSDASKQAMVYNLVEVMDKKVNASPTLLINNNIVVKGVKPALMQMLPDLLFPKE
jgi:predicted DsbA family dithiol-disulfide isomerase